MVYMLLGTGFEETEAITPLDLMRRAGIEVKTVGLNGKIIYGGHDLAWKPTFFPKKQTSKLQKCSFCPAA